MSIDAMAAQTVEANNTPLLEYVRIASNHYGDLNPMITAATTPHQLVHELHVAREEALKIGCMVSHTEEYRSVYHEKVINVLMYLTQVRHEFNLAIGERY